MAHACMGGVCFWLGGWHGNSGVGGSQPGKTEKMMKRPSFCTRRLLEELRHFFEAARGARVGRGEMDRVGLGGAGRGLGSGAVD